MILALLWLTVSAPFVFAAQQETGGLGQTCTASQTSLPVTASEEDSTNPFGNNTEEKAPSSSTFSEEYLHDHHSQGHFPGKLVRHNGSGNTGIYIAYHGELHVPPPNAA